MKNVIPGGHYSYDPANKKIWPSYEYYNLSVENIFRIRNLSRDMEFYNADNPKYPLVMENGCITHSYPSDGLANDKLQIVLRTPIPGSLELLEATDGVITLETTGKVLVLPTENAAILPSYNEYVANTNRLTADFGGLKGSESPDYLPGTLYTSTDGVYLTDITGQNSTKTLTAGKLKELGYLAVDTAAHTITQEFTARNDGDNNPSVAIDSSIITGWSAFDGTGTISSTDGRLIFSGNAKSTGIHSITKALNINLSSPTFVSFDIVCSQSCTLYLRLESYTGSSYPIMSYTGSRFPVSANTLTRFVLPIHAPVATSGQNPSRLDAGFLFTAISRIWIGIGDVGSESANTYSISNIYTNVAKSAYVEVQVPDNLSATSLALYTHNGTAYQLASTHSLDAAYAQVAQTSANFTAADGTKFDDVYGAGAGRAVFPKGSSGETKDGSSGNITYSGNKGTSKRIGLRVDLPPASGLFSQCRFKTVIRYIGETGSQISLNQSTDQSNIIGFERDSSNESPTLRRIDVDGNTVTSYNFDTNPIFSGQRRCVISGDKILYGSNARGDGLDLSGASGNLMVERPKFYYKYEYSAPYYRYWFSPYPHTGFTLHPWFVQRGGTDRDFVYIGAKEASGEIESGVFKLKSATGKVPCTGSVAYPNLPNSGRLTLDDAETYAKNNGTGWGITDVWGYSAIQALIFCETGTFDTQTALGMGIVDLASGTGYAGKTTGADSIDSRLGTNGTGTGSGTNGQTPVCWRGIENIYGNCWEFIAGLNLNLSDGSYTILKRDGTGTPSATLAEGSYETGAGTVPVSEDGYINGIQSEELGALSFIPSANAGSSSTYLCDYFYYPRYNPSIMRFGGSWDHGPRAGPGCRGAYNAPSASARYIGARLEFIADNLHSVENMGSTTHEFTDSTNTSYGLQNLTKPWLALYDPSTSIIDFYLHTHRPQALSFKRDETGTIHELNLYPGEGSIYHGQISFADLALDTDSDLIPDCLEASINGSITQFLKNYTMVI